MTFAKGDRMYRSYRPSDNDDGMDQKFDQFDGRPRIINDKLLAKLYDIHRKPRQDLADLGMLDRPKQYRRQFP
jgi:hypothetical protein